MKNPIKLKRLSDKTLYLRHQMLTQQQVRQMSIRGPIYLDSSGIFKRFKRNNAVEISKRYKHFTPLHPTYGKNVLVSQLSELDKLASTFDVLDYETSA